MTASRRYAEASSDLVVTLERADSFLSERENPHRKALDCLCERIDPIKSKRTSSEWKKADWPKLEDFIGKLVDIGFSLHTQKLYFRDKLFNALRNVRESIRGSSFADDIWRKTIGLVVKHTEELMTRRYGEMKGAAEKPSAELQALAALTGLSMQKLVEDRFNANDTFKVVAEFVLDHRYVGTSGSQQRIFLLSAMRLLDIVSNCKLPSSLLQVVADKSTNYLYVVLFKPITRFVDERSDQQRRSNENARTQSDNRMTFYEYVIRTNPSNASETPTSNIEHAVELLTALQRTATQHRLWKAAWSGIESSRKFLTELIMEPKRIGLVSREKLVEMCRTTAEVFKACGNFTFHAVSLRIASSFSHGVGQELRTLLVTESVIAALCAPEISEQRRLFGSFDNEFAVGIQIAKLFDMEAAPSSTTLVQELMQTGLMQLSMPQAGALVDLLQKPLNSVDEASNMCKTVEALFSEIVAQLPSLEEYRHSIRRRAMSRFFEVVADTVSEVQLRDLHNAAGYQCSFEEDLTVEMEPVLTRELQLPVLIDHRGSSVTFTTSAQRRVHTAFANLATAVADTTAKKSTAARRKPLIFSSSELDKETDRSIMVHELQKQREARSKNLKEADRKRVEEDQREADRKRIDEEKERVRRQQDATNDRMMLKFKAAEQKERRKLLVKRLREKYRDLKGFVLDDKMADLPDQQFLDVVATALTAATRLKELEKSSETRQADHLARALRERDLEKRKELVASRNASAEVNKAADDAFDTMLENHADVHNQKVELVQYLKGRYRHAADVFEKQVSRQTKTTNRDEQEMLLQQEKERLARGA